MRSPPRDETAQTDDPVLAMLGVGRQLWELESGDSFVERLRSEELPALPPTRHSTWPAESLPDGGIWREITHEG